MGERNGKQEHIPWEKGKEYMGERWWHIYILICANNMIRKCEDQ